MNKVREREREGPEEMVGNVSVDHLTFLISEAP